jgi:hypothetical protein
VSDQSDRIQIDEDVDNVIVVDSDEYRKTQKLRSIQDAKDHFTDLRQNRSDRLDDLSSDWQNYHDVYEEELATAISLYVSELMPLIEEALSTEALDEQELHISTARAPYHTIDIREVARKSGKAHIGGEEMFVPAPVCQQVYRQSERLERKLGLGLDLEPDKGPAEI